MEPKEESILVIDTRGSRITSRIWEESVCVDYEFNGGPLFEIVEVTANARDLAVDFVEEIAKTGNKEQREKAEVALRLIGPKRIVIEGPVPKKGSP